MKKLSWRSTFDVIRIPTACSVCQINTTTTHTIARCGGCRRASRASSQICTECVCVKCTSAISTTLDMIIHKVSVNGESDGTLTDGSDSSVEPMEYYDSDDITKIAMDNCEQNRRNCASKNVHVETRKSAKFSTRHAKSNHRLRYHFWSDSEPPRVGVKLSVDRKGRVKFKLYLRHSMTISSRYDSNFWWK